MQRVTVDFNVYDETACERLLQLLSINTQGMGVELELKNEVKLTPFAIVALACAIRRWLKGGSKVKLLLDQTGGLFKYLQRMDFFSNLGVDLEETFQRHEAQKRFVPLVKIIRDGRIEPVAEAIANCVIPDVDGSNFDPETSGPWDLLNFAVSELVLNVRQHAASEGFVMAQHFQATDLVRVAVGDFGLGLRASFEVSGSPVFRHGWTDVDALETALMPRISSKSQGPQHWGSSANAGMGLTIIKELTKINGGSFLLASGTAVHNGTTTRSALTNTGYGGTICGFSFNRSKTKSFAEALFRANRASGLISTDNPNYHLFS